MLIKILLFLLATPVLVIKKWYEFQTTVSITEVTKAIINQWFQHQAYYILLMTHSFATTALISSWSLIFCNLNHELHKITQIQNY